MHTNEDNKPYFSFTDVICVICLSIRSISAQRSKRLYFKPMTSLYCSLHILLIAYVLETYSEQLH